MQRARGATLHWALVRLFVWLRCGFFDFIWFERGNLYEGLHNVGKKEIVDEYVKRGTSFGVAKHNLFRDLPTDFGEVGDDDDERL